MGDLKKSQQLEQSIINGLNKIRGLSSQRRQKVINEIEVLQPKIKKLLSWRHWGTLKSREKIIEEIKNLPGTEKNLDKIASRIKQARAQWKEWDNSGEGGDNQLYKKFDTACCKAYEPCKALFEQQRKQRIQASQARTEICQKLEDEYNRIDWRNPEWKKLQNLIREQQSHWRKAGGAEYRDRKPLQKRFDLILEKYDGPLDREHKRNFAQRKDLIAEINTLTTLEDSRKAIADLQLLKKKWQVTVSGKRSKEQSVWKQFTAACDAVYDKSRQTRKAIDLQLNSQLDTKRKLCDQIEAALLASGTDAVTLAAQIIKWKADWSATGNAPRENIRQIDKRFRDAMTKVNQHLGQMKQADQKQTDSKLFASADVCNDLEKLVLDNPDSDIEPVLERWQALEPLAPPQQKMMQDRLDMILSASRNQQQLSDLRRSFNVRFDELNGYLLQLEINTGVDSPPVYAKQRMALQIGRLSAAMGKSANQKLFDSAELIIRIHATGAIDPAKRTEIQQRFNNCYQAI